MIYHPLNIQEDVSSCLFSNFSHVKVYVTSPTAGDIKLTDASWNKQFSQEEQKVCHLVQDSHAAVEAEKSQSGGEAQTPQNGEGHVTHWDTDSGEIFESAHTIKHMMVSRLIRTNVQLLETFNSWLFHWLAYRKSTIS